MISFSGAFKSFFQYYFDFSEDPTWVEFWWFTLLITISIISLTLVGNNVDISWPLYGIVPVRYGHKILTIIITIGFYQPERFRV